MPILGDNIHVHEQIESRQSEELVKKIVRQRPQVQHIGMLPVDVPRSPTENAVWHKIW